MVCLRLRQIHVPILVALTAVPGVLCFAPSTSVGRGGGGSLRNTIQQSKRRVITHSSSSTQRQSLMMMMAPALSELTDLLATTVTHGHHALVASNHHHHPSIIDSIVSSTTYIDGVVVPVGGEKMAAAAAAHGHSQPLFGPPDPYLQQIKSIAPAPGAFEKAGIQIPSGTTTLLKEEDIADRVKGAVDFARKKDAFLDPTQIFQLHGDAGPGFVEPRGFFPTIKPVPQTDDYTRGVIEAEMGRITILSKIPLAAFITIAVDFFLIRPGTEVFKDEIDETEDDFVRETAAAGVVRILALAAVAGLVLITTTLPEALPS